jgi:hypothetical protein
MSMQRLLPMMPIFFAPFFLLQLMVASGSPALACARHGAATWAVSYAGIPHAIFLPSIFPFNGTLLCELRTLYTCTHACSPASGEEYEPDARLLEMATSVVGEEETSLAAMDEDYASTILDYMRFFGSYSNDVAIEDVKKVGILHMVVT